MNNDEIEAISDIDPVEFELAAGFKVRLALGHVWTKVNEADRMLGIRPVRYLAIRVYSDEDTFPRRMRQIHEMRHGKEFEARNCPKIWRWLLAHAGSRSVLDHETPEDFLVYFEAIVARIQAEDEDMLEHLEKLPALTLPFAFDRYDDSVFTDQTDPEPI